MVDVTKDSVYPKIKKSFSEEDVGNSFMKINISVKDNYIDELEMDWLK